MIRSFPQAFIADVTPAESPTVPKAETASAVRDAKLVQEAFSARFDCGAARAARQLAETTIKALTPHNKKKSPESQAPDREET
jgi:hypothetical protein